MAYDGRVRPVRDPNLVFRRIADDWILVPIRQEVPDVTKIFVLNETGARIWDLMDGVRTADEIAAEIASEFDVEAAAARTYVRGFLDRLSAIPSPGRPEAVPA